MSYVKYTKTSTFLFPLLGIPKSIFQCDVKNIFNRSILTSRFINSFILDESITEYDTGHIFILVNSYQDVAFSTFYSTITAFDNYVDDYEKNGYLVLVFSIPENFKKDSELIIKDGLYSKLSTRAKKIILENCFYNGSNVTISLILNKSPGLKESWNERLTFIGKDIFSPVDIGDQEVWSSLTIEKETLTKEIMLELAIKDKMIPSKEFEK